MKIKIIDSQTNNFEEKELSAKQKQYSLGRHSSCDLILDKPDVSRIHGRIIKKENNFFYQDLVSTGGSWINNQAVSPSEPYVLKTNDTIRLGSYLIVVVELDKEETQTSIAEEKETGKHLNQQWWQNGEIELICKRVIPETTDVKTFVFVSESGKLFTYKPGQFVTLSLNINEKIVKRSYSISSTPTRPYTLEITVKRVPAPEDDPNIPPGLVSNWLHDQIQVGSKITVSGPSGKFTCYEQSTEKLLLISAGSGITPMMSMSRWLTDLVSDTDIIFFHGARSPKDIIFKHELDLLSARHPNFKVAIAITRSSKGEPWLGYVGRFSDSMLQLVAPDFKDRIVYLCGPDGFMKKVKSTFEALDFPMANFHQESFGGSKKYSSPVKKESESSLTAKQSLPSSKETLPSSPQQKALKPMVAFQISQEEFFCDEGKTILELALAEGINIDYSCASGACGTCQVKRLSGEYRYLQEPSCEPDADHILTCIATAVGRVELEA